MGTIAEKYYSQIYSLNELKLHKLFLSSSLSLSSESSSAKIAEFFEFEFEFAALVRAMCSVKLVDKRNTVELMDMIALKEAADKLAMGNGVRWFGHVLRQPEEDVLMKEMLDKVDRKCK